MTWSLKANRICSLDSGLKRSISEQQEERWFWSIPKSMAFSVFIITAIFPELGMAGNTAHSSYYSERRRSSSLEDYYQEDEQTSSESSIPIIPWRQINFISPNRELISRFWYEGPLSFSAKGMDHLYLLNHYFMDWLQPPGLPPGIVKDELFEDPEVVLRANRERILSHFWGMILASTIAFCFAVIVPLLGFLLCCCWCNSGSSKGAKSGDGQSPLYHNSSGSSGGSPRNNRKKKKAKYKVEKGCDSFCRSFCGVNLFILLLLLSFFVICSFVTNEYVQNGFNLLPKTVNQSLDDIQLYLNNTQYEVSTLLRTNFKQLEQELDESLDKSGLIVKNRLALVSQAVALENLTEIVSKLETIHTDLKELDTETRELKTSVHMLGKGLNKAKDDLEKVFRECLHPICINLKRRYHNVLNRFRVSTSLDDLPVLTPLMQNISALLQADIVHEVQKGKASFDRISLKIQSAVNDSIPDIKRQIRSVGQELSATAHDINEALRLPFSDIKRGKHNVYLGTEYIDEYEIYRWYGCLGGTCVILGILALYTLGLLYGVCKTQPTVHDYRNRRYKPPSTCPLSCGIFLVFLCFGALLLCTILLFISGGLADRVACYYFEHPSDPEAKKLFGYLQDYYEKNYITDTSRIIRGVKPNVAEVLSRCHQNLSLYNALQLNKHNRIQLRDDKVIEGFNVTYILQFKGRYRIEERLERFLTHVDVNPAPIIILTREGQKLLDQLRETSLGTLNFSSFADLVHQRVTPLDLISVSQELEREAKLLPPSQLEYSSELKNIALMLESYQIKVVSQIQDSVGKIKSDAEKIQQKSQYGSKGLKEALTDLLEQAKKAQQFIEHKGRAEIRKVAKGFVADMSSLIDQYAQHVVEEVETNIGRCEPVSRAINATALAICKEIVLPFNGYWLSMASALLCSLPATMCAYILSKLFQKLKGSKGRRHLSVDSDLTLDHMDEDDIPLAQVGHKNEIPVPFESRRNPPPPNLFLDSSTAAPSAPISGVEDNWSPGAPPPHIYTRPPPYNFAN